MKTLSRFTLKLAAAIVAGGLLTPNAQAVEAAGAKGPLHGKLGQRAKEKLGLTDDQVAQIKEQVKSEKDNLVSLRTRLRDARTGMREVMQKADATEASVREAFAKLAAVQSDMAVEHFKLHSKISPLLTPEQREKMSQLRNRADGPDRRAMKRAQKRLGE